MENAPQNIQDQIQQVAEYFAEMLPACDTDHLPHVPQWLSLDAQRWITRNHASFSQIVLAAHREFVSQ